MKEKVGCVKRITNRISEYCKDIKDYGSFSKCAKFSILLLTLILLADIVNLPTKIIFDYSLLTFITVFAFIFLLVFIFFIVDNHMLDLLKTNNVNEVDSAIVLLLLSAFVYMGVLAVIDKASFYKWVVLLIFSLMLFTCLCTRIWKTQRKISICENNNIIDIKDLLDETVKHNNELPILLAEKDVSYDLLDRKVIIDQLTESIKACKNYDGTFVIGLEGAWGSGKTTIINNVRQNLLSENNSDYIIINTFDPWIYNSQEALLIALFDNVLNKTGLKYNKSAIKKISKTLISSIMGEDKLNNVISKVLIPADEKTSISSIKAQFNNYLENTNKTVIAFIDNIDRASGENIIFIFKIISTIFDLKRTVYILSYDRERVDKILSENMEIDKHFIEKIVQQEIKVSSIGKEKMHILVSESLKNMLQLYGASEEEIPNYEFIFEYLSKNIKDIRELKRIFNSTIPLLFKNEALYKPDLLALLIVRFYSVNLYNEINENRQFFVSVDIEKETDLFSLSFSFQRNNFNEEGKKFYDNIKNSYGKKILELLSNIFPYTKKYLDGLDLKSEYENYDESYAEVNRYCRIASAKYFDLYFSFCENDFTVISKLYNVLISDAENHVKNNTTEKIQEDFILFFTNTPSYYHEDIIKTMWCERNNFNNNLNYPILLGLIKSSLLISDEKGFLSLSAYQRACSIMATLYLKTTEYEKRSIRECFIKEIKLYKTLDEMIYWINSSRTNYQGKEDDENELNSLRNEIYNTIISTPVNLFDDKYYSKHITWILIREKRRTMGLDESANVEIHDYIIKIFEPKYVYKLIKETVSSTSGSDRYNYWIPKSSINSYVADESIINEAIKQYPPTNEKEIFLKELFCNYLADTDSQFYDNGYKSSYPIDY